MNAPINAESLYAFILQRAPDPQGLSYWDAQIAARGTADVAWDLIQSREALDSGYGVIAAYQLVFGRVPDEDGFAYWQEMLAGTDDVSAVIGSLLTSAEFTESSAANDRGAFIADLYRNGLGREPEPEGLLYWFESGLTNQALVEAFMTSWEWLERASTKMGEFYADVADGSQDYEGSLFDVDVPELTRIGDAAPGEADVGAQPDFAGVARPGHTVVVVVDGDEVGRTVVDEDGTWAVTPDTPLQPGASAVTVVAEDALGNQSPASEEVAIVIVDDGSGDGGGGDGGIGDGDGDGGIGDGDDGDGGGDGGDGDGGDGGDGDGDGDGDGGDGDGGDGDGDGDGDGGDGDGDGEDGRPVATGGTLDASIIVSTEQTTGVLTGQSGAIVAVSLLGSSFPPFEFSVAEGATRDIDITGSISAVVGLQLGLTASLLVRTGEDQWETVSTGGSGPLLDVSVLSSGDAVRATLENVPAGEYRVEMTSTLGVGVGQNVSYEAAFTDTSLTAQGQTVTGDLSMDDFGPGGLAEVQIQNPDGEFVPADGSPIAGAHGVLTIDAQGAFTYTPDSEADVVGQTETFTYRLVHPETGASEPADLLFPIDGVDADAEAGIAGDMDVMAISAWLEGDTLTFAEDGVSEDAAVAPPEPDVPAELIGVPQDTGNDVIV